MNLIGDNMATQEGIEFVSWLKMEMERRGWGTSDLARSSGLNKGSVSNLLNYKRQPSDETCRAFAKALGYPEAFVFEKAGKLSPPPPSDDLEFRRLQQIMREMTQEQRMEVIQFALDKFRRPNTKQELLQLLKEMRRPPGDEGDNQEPTSE